MNLFSQLIFSILTSCTNVPILMRIHSCKDSPAFVFERNVVESPKNIILMSLLHNMLIYFIKCYNSFFFKPPKTEESKLDLMKIRPCVPDTHLSLFCLNSYTKLQNTFTITDRVEDCDVTESIFSQSPCSLLIEFFGFCMLNFGCKITYHIHKT